MRHMTFLGGLFGNNANKPATGGGLFGNTNNTFGNNNQNKSGGGMFGNSGGFGTTNNTSGNREKNNDLHPLPLTFRRPFRKYKYEHK